MGKRRLVVLVEDWFLKVETAMVLLSVTHFTSVVMDCSLVKVSTLWHGEVPVSGSATPLSTVSIL
jgi:hypothetical protein